MDAATYVIDRFDGGGEGKKAILERENGSVMAVSAALLPENAREGDAVTECAGKYYIDHEQTQMRRETAARIFNKLTGGDVT